MSEVAVSCKLTCAYRNVVFLINSYRCPCHGEGDSVGDICWLEPAEVAPQRIGRPRAGAACAVNAAAQATAIQVVLVIEEMKS